MERRVSVELVAGPASFRERESNKHAKLGLSEVGLWLLALRMRRTGWTHAECRSQRRRFEVVRGGSRSERRKASKFCDMRCGEGVFDSETGEGNT